VLWSQWHLHNLLFLVDRQIFLLCRLYREILRALLLLSLYSYFLNGFLLDLRNYCLILILG